MNFTYEILNEKVLNLINISCKILEHKVLKIINKNDIINFLKVKFLLPNHALNFLTF